MPALGKTAFTGASGKAYRFKVYALGTKFRKLSGVFVVASRSNRADGSHQHVPLFVGQTEDLSQPFEKHRKADDLAQNGANCICLLADDSETSRQAKEQDLVAGLHPTCNQ
jgi:hypothetical protein